MSTLYEFLTKIVNLFPSDPLAKAVQSMDTLDILGYLNYFLPIKTIASITNAWVIGIVAAKMALFAYRILIKKV